MSSSSPSSPSLLCVDDDSECLELVRYALELAYPDATVLTRTDAESGLATLSVESVDVVISDSVHLEDGTPLVEAVRNDYPAVPTVLYTGKPFDTVAGIVAGAGVSEYVQKGASGRLNRLVAEVDKLVESTASTPASDTAELTTVDATEHLSLPQAPTDISVDVTGDEWTQMARCDPTSVDDLVVALVDVLGAPANGRPLSDLVDVEALALLFESHTAETPFYVRFSLATHDVVVTDDGVVAIRTPTSA